MSQKNSINLYPRKIIVVHLYTEDISCDQLQLAMIISYLCILGTFLAVSYIRLYLLTRILEKLYLPQELTFFVHFC